MTYFFCMIYFADDIYSILRMCNHIALTTVQSINISSTIQINTMYKHSVAVVAVDNDADSVFIITK